MKQTQENSNSNINNNQSNMKRANSCKFKRRLGIASDSLKEEYHQEPVATERNINTTKYPIMSQSAHRSLVILLSCLHLLQQLATAQDQHQQQHASLQQYLQQRSSIYQQQQANLVNSAAAAYYQNDQPRSSHGGSESAQPLTRQQPQFLDNVIESTTSSNSMYDDQQQAFPHVSEIVERSSAVYQLPQQTCQLPMTWAGKWYQVNKDTIRVTNTEISDKGICRDKKGDKYLFEQVNRQADHQSCLVCLVINERHLNVLQYKESTCQTIPAQYLNRTNNQLILDNDHSLLDTICSDITGDAQLESMFRLDTPSIECPINGKYHFTYDNCREPLSSLDSCIDKKQLNFKFSACPDVPGSESKSEVLKCYADWSEGNNYYMIGRLEHASNHPDKGKFRCFVYERAPNGEYIQMAQSQEGSCYGLINPYEGPKTLRLTPRQATGNRCQFPTFIQSQSENWLSVDNSLIYMFNSNSTKYQVKETKEGNVNEEATCLEQVRHPHQVAASAAAHLHQARSNQAAHQPTTARRYPPSSNNFNQIDQSHQAAASSLSSTRQTINDVVYLVQITKNCYTTDYCVRFYRRTSGIVQIDYFIALPGDNGQQRCRNAFIGTPQTQIITSTNLEQQRCPFEGAYTIEAPPESDFSYNPSNIFICPRQSYLTAQCDNPTRLRIHYKCSPAKYMIKNLYCLGSWTTNGLVRLLLADDERQRYSAWYRDYGAMVAPSTALGATSGEPETMTNGLTRSQQLLGGMAAASNSLASIVDLQIALLTAPPNVSKPMQVRLTRRSQCSDLRGYSNQGSFSSMSSSSSASISSYASPSATSSASNHLNDLNLTQVNNAIPILLLMGTTWFLNIVLAQQRRQQLFANQ